MGPSLEPRACAEIGSRSFSSMACFLGYPPYLQFDSTCSGKYVCFLGRKHPMADPSGSSVMSVCSRPQNKRASGVEVFAAVQEEYFTAPEMDFDMKGDGIADDYYSVLGLSHNASPEEIKRAYYSCMKACHPDLAGEQAETTTFCMFVNEVYEVLSDPIQRMVYDEINGFSLTSINPFLDVSSPRDHVFVDEFTCIGCKNCANTAPKVFEIEEDFGRARAVSQCGRASAVQRAIDT